MNAKFGNGQGITSMLKGIAFRRGMAWGGIIIGALVAFEVFNYSTTQFALTDVLGNLKFAGLSWATILALAFCGIDFAGIARLFTPEKGQNEPTEVWYLFGAWLLAAGMNAVLTWWGVSVAIVNHTSQADGAFVANSTLIRVVPVFVAIMVWLIRVLIIGTFSVAGERLFSQGDSSTPRHLNRPPLRPASAVSAQSRPVATTSFQSTGQTAHSELTGARTEPAYHNLPMSAKSARHTGYTAAPRHS